MEASQPSVPASNPMLRETKLTVVSKLLRRVIQHLTRRTALLAIILGCIAALVAIAVGPSTPVGEVMLVAMGIFISVVVLPEIPHRLWNVKPLDLADTVPADHLLEASKSIAEAIDMQARRGSTGSMLPDKLIISVWGETLDLLLDLIDDPSKVVQDLEYSARVEPATEAKAWHSVDTTIRAERHLPRAKEGCVWFSYCSSMSSLSTEFAQHSEGCIARELIEKEEGEDADAWFHRVANYPVFLNIDGKRVETMDTERITTTQGLIYRTKYEPGMLADRFVATELRIAFSLPSKIDDLPVKFAAYSVVGTASVTIEILDNTYEIDYDEYLSPSSRNLSINRDTTDRSTICTIRTSGHTVLPIGAGAVFSWQRLS